jgi:hypothetical protein
MSTLNVTNLKNITAGVTNVSLLADGSTALVLDSTGTSRLGGIRYNAGNLEVYTSGNVWASVGGGGGGTVTGVTASLPLVSSGGAAPNLTINAATSGSAGSMSAADKTKLDAIPATVVSSVTGTAPVAVATGTSTPVVSITPGTARQLLQTNAGATAVEFASNIDVPGTLDVTGVATFDSQVVASAGTAAAPSVTFTGDTDTGIYSAGAGRLSVSNNGVNTVEVTAAGNVLVGGTLPASPNNQILSTGRVNHLLGATLGSPIGFPNNVSPYGTNVQLAICSSSENSQAAIGFIGPSDNCRIFTSGAGSNINIVAGTSGGVILTATSTSWAAISDEREKTDLVAIEDGLNKVSTLRAVTGRYKTDEEGISRSFLVAQDVQAVLPEAVSEEDNEDKTLSLRYTEVIPLLVSALRDAKERIESLEAEVAALKGA